MSSLKNVLVFGAAGGVGRVAAKTASSQGAKVWLAMRDTNKPIPGLTADAEKEAGYTRVQADLTQRDSIQSAVSKSGATTAFVYTVMGSEDCMKTGFNALKDAGINYIVLLSSIGVSTTSSESSFIPKLHKDTEASLHATGIKYVALRPGYFCTNLFHTQGYQKGVLELFLPKAVHDFIAPEDIGTVAGNLLITPPEKQPADNGIYLCGPKLMDMYESTAIVSEVLGHGIRIEELSEEEFRGRTKMPKMVVDSLVSIEKMSTPPNVEDIYPKQFYNDGSDNVRTYAKREPTGFKAWVEAHKGELK
jgi:uncharacterized protein YbjT (DUF2867 family)